METLAPDETRTIHGFVDVPNSFEPLSAYTFNTTLSLESPDEVRRLRAAQIEEHRVSVAARYDARPSDVVIAVNNETTPREIAEWKRFLENEIGLKVAIWDMSYYANFDLGARKVTNPKWKLLQEFAGKTIIVLNNHFKSYSAQRITAMEYLSQGDIQDAINLYGINFSL